MAQDSPTSRSQAKPQTAGGGQPYPSPPGGASLSTDDPLVAKSAQTPPSPQETVRYQTSQSQPPPNAYPFESGPDVVREQNRPQGDSRHADGKENRPGPPRDNKPSGEPRHGQGRSTWRTMLMAAVLALICGVVGGWGYTALFGSSKANEKESASANDKQSEKGDKSGGQDSKSGGDKKQASGDQGSGGASASTIPGFNSAHDAGAFKKELEHLAHRLDLLGGRIDRITTNEDKTPPVLHTMQRKMADLEGELYDVSRLPAKINKIEKKLADLDQELKILSDRVSGAETPLTGKRAPPADNPAPPVAAPAGTPPQPDNDANPADEATLKLADGLLGEGHYAQSYRVLRRLQRAQPRDARVWYLSALAYGLSSGKWDDEAERLAAQGAKCERAGHPSRRDIDDALAGLHSNSGKNWIASRRAKATTR